MGLHRLGHRCCRGGQLSIFHQPSDGHFPDFTGAALPAAAPPDEKRAFSSLQNRLRARAAYLCAIVACAYPVLQPNALETFGVRTDVWDQSGSYSKDGALAVFLRNTQFMSVEPPQDPSAQNVQRIAQQVAPVEPAVSTDTRPNIIAIMNESWADFESFGNLSLSESVTDFIDSLDNCIRGHCYTSVFGAGTQRQRI